MGLGKSLVKAINESTSYSKIQPKYDIKTDKTKIKVSRIKKALSVSRRALKLHPLCAKYALGI